MSEDFIDNLNPNSHLYRFIRECSDHPIGGDLYNFGDPPVVSENLNMKTQSVRFSNSSAFVPDDTAEKLTKGKQKIPIEFIDDRSKRYSTFSKRKTGLMKKAVELAELTGAEVLLLIASETNHVYTFATQRLKGIVELECGKKLIQTCLSSNYSDLCSKSTGKTNSDESQADFRPASSCPSVVRSNFKRTMPIHVNLDVTEPKLARYSHEVGLITPNHSHCPKSNKTQRKHLKIAPKPTCTAFHSPNPDTNNQNHATSLVINDKSNPNQCLLSSSDQQTANMDSKHVNDSSTLKLVSGISNPLNFIFSTSNELNSKFLILPQLTPIQSELVTIQSGETDKTIGSSFRTVSADCSQSSVITIDSSNPINAHENYSNVTRTPTNPTSNNDDDCFITDGVDNSLTEWDKSKNRPKPNELIKDDVDYSSNLPT